jgi:FG-GAP repeat
MKKIFTLSAACFIAMYAPAQIGIGTTNPQATLDINGTLKIGAVSNGAPAKGTIRWNENNKDFEGFNGSAWVSLTGAKGNWGSDVHYTHEGSASSVMLQVNDQGNMLGKRLGTSMAMVNNYLLAGAPADYNTLGTVQQAGTVRILKKENGRWEGFKTVWPPEATPMSGNFGSSVSAISSHFIVGARMATTGGNYAQGKAYIYGINLNGDVALQAQLTAPDGTLSDYFGSSVAMTNMHALVGAPGDNVLGQVNRGTAYIFQRNIITNTWAYQATLQPPDGAEDDVFGNAVAISGTIAAVASPLAKVGSQFRVGKVYIFRLVNNVWTYAQTITPPNPLSFDKFGSSLCMTGDTLVIGSPQYNGIQLSNKGKVYIYYNTNGTMQLQHTLEANDGKNADAFGGSVHLYNSQLIVGAMYANVMARELQGKAYVFKKQGNSWMQQAVLISSNGMDNDAFGSAVVLGAHGAAVSSPVAPYKGYDQHGRIYFYDE